MSARKITAAMGIVVLSGMSVLLFPATGLAHAAYEYSEPAKGATVSSPPSEVMANYTEPLSEGSYLKVYDSCGDQVDSGDVRIFNDEMSVSVAASKSGEYEVDWLAISDIDPHSTRGSFTFTVTSGEVCPAPERESTKENRPGDSEDSVDRGSGPESDSLDTDEASNGNNQAGLSGGSGNGRGGNAGELRQTGDRLSNPNLAVRQTEEAPKSPGALDLPWGKVAIAWLVAAAIGAVGGLIYDGIMGPRAE